ncbi:GNAT family N-acetyltransferase [Sporosarcina sp. G11-34]|uniref:GNAT family N-acetyltransferase n=1 Tax=Sporosarcina sp. G11-34 TaxID=2849605 RepID=UPI0022A9C65D|nr:N-acetyltransferase [Sporosarcina sp. G11-34]MCZ2257927.1 GNAT family N-acetyltransferase [Sporosarcina sp. G11-34]
MIIRQATIKDAHAVQDVLITSQWFTYESLYSKEYIQQLIDQYYNFHRIADEIQFMNTSWHGYYVAEMPGKIVGVIGGGMIGETAGEVYVFYMNPTVRGMGIGTRLLNFFTKIQKHTYGATEQWVAVAKGNNYAIPFYKARGFIFQCEEPTYGSSETDLDIALKFKRKI